MCVVFAQSLDRYCRDGMPCSKLQDVNFIGGAGPSGVQIGEEIVSDVVPVEEGDEQYWGFDRRMTAT